MSEKIITRQVRIEKNVHRDLKLRAIEAGMTMSALLSSILAEHFQKVSTRLAT